MTACARCQKRKIRCDGVTPVCGGCQRAHVDCVEGVSFRDISRNYVDELEARIEWLESIIREHLPSFDLHKSEEPEKSVRLDCQRGSDARPSQARNDKDDWGPARDITDQLGMISINPEADLRYLGPSSGLFFTRFVLTGLGRKAELERGLVPPPGDANFVPAELLDIQPKGLPSDLKQAQWLTQGYFEAVHGQFPFLHRPSHLDLLQKAYNGVGLLPVDQFQIYMVLAIGATIRSRQLKVLLSAEGYCTSAMVHLDTIFQKSSVRGVQCMLLLQMYTFHNPSSTISLWTLHYQCLAHVLELGLHRNVQGTTAFTEFDREMRTRVFWCVYTMDRYLCTSLGRAIGIMDEQCDLRLPHDLNDEDLHPDQPIPTQPSTTPTDMSSAIHLFKLARFNAEIKCVLYCVDRNSPPYTQPSITDPKHWQQDILHRLHQWKAAIPHHPPENPAYYHLNSLLEIKYHELVMLIVRPSPQFPYPSRPLIKLCFDSALECTRLYHQLYATNMLQYTRMIVQSLFLCTITIFYCIWAPGGMGEEGQEEAEEATLHALKSISDILSATGEYWLEVKRSRDVLDSITRAAVRRFARRGTGRSLSSSAASSLPPPNNNINNGTQDMSTVSLPSTLNDASCAAAAADAPVLTDPYYMPNATSDFMSFFMDPQPESAMELLDFSWDVYGGGIMDDVMQDTMISGNNSRAW
ncbi:hypothetical protein ASPBRDRAFT_114274 [Aspergillus brasiliensis CBS 101740]|uniref:Zn(2)-C6 fungal-type domain-containing protein n=1 Tax=Aspergillus brasiliensis (strain CBS 101740 / IMI 381727 / IBT 21946) TaxID=767769 RepID=A0A1L9V1K6_ASPBC|nr:hypothetical protein ASPBRDRAFT_114274 [Aspergillus brasiliensis CBS 101740]